jgi:predicted transcriptional regulator
VKTTIELPDELLREAKETAARQGSSLKAVLTAALRSHLARTERAPRGKEAWRSVAGRAAPQDVATVDRVVTDELESVDLETWR